MQEQLIPTLYVKSMFGNNLTLQNDIFPSDLVTTLKYRIYEYEGTPPDN